jgi:hypothetical protein
MKAHVFAGLLFLLMAGLAHAGTDAEVAVELTDPAGDVSGEGYRPNDVVAIKLSSDGEHVIIATTLKDAVKPDTESVWERLLLSVSFDADNDPKSGGQAYAGYTADVPGMDFGSEIMSDGRSASGSIFSIDERGNQKSIRYSGDTPNTPVKGNVYTAKYPYADLGLKSGQVIRVVIREVDDRSQDMGVHPGVLLKLK